MASTVLVKGRSRSSSLKRQRAELLQLGPCASWLAGFKSCFAAGSHRGQNFKRGGVIGGVVGRRRQGVDLFGGGAEAEDQDHWFVNRAALSRFYNPAVLHLLVPCSAPSRTSASSQLYSRLLAQLVDDCLPLYIWNGRPRQGSSNGATRARDAPSVAAARVRVLAATV